MMLATIYLGAVLVISFITFVVYGYDKRQASGRGRRISERTLHWLSLLGGWPGAMLAQRLFRHKTYKRSFRLVFWASVIGHLSLTGVVVWLMQ